MKRDQFLNFKWISYPTLGDDFKIAGRIESISASQISIAQKGSWTLQPKVQIQSEVLASDELTQILKVDDIVGLKLSEHITGQITEIQLLAPALGPKLILNSNPKIQAQWFQFLEQVRTFFKGKGFSEAQTPTLVQCPGTEPFLDLFSTDLSVGSQKKKLYLPTSPELHLKKLLSAGYENIFEIKNCFRNGEITERHQPEFQMLEWYRSYQGLDQIMQDCLHLLDFLGFATENFKRVTIAELFKSFCDFELTATTSIDELKSLAKKLDLKVENFEMWDDVFFLIFIEKVEPFIDSKDPVFVEKYPPSQAALARLTKDGWGDRFELYFKGFEIANAFHELNDPKVQLLRSMEDLEKKRKLGKETPPLDDQFMQALQGGMPPSAGIALGLERLFMAKTGITQIADLKPFSHKA